MDDSSSGSPLGSPPGSTLDTPVWVVVPAAGSGQRLGGTCAKQYQLLNGVTMLERTLERMLLVPGVEAVVVVLASDDDQWQHLGCASDPRVRTVIGRDTRAGSVMAGIDEVLQHARPDTWVMVHDAARPLVAASDIQRLINAVYNSGAVGGLLATPVHDTLKRADDYAAVMQTVERVDLWQAQTPQLFRVGALHQAIEHGTNQEACTITDEASAMEQAGHQPLLVEALQPNFKITRPVDLQLASAVLRNPATLAEGHSS